MSDYKITKYNYNRATEIRTLCASVVNHLSKILDPQSNWKDLMGHIPKNLEIIINLDYEQNYEKKYTSEDIKLLENAKIIDNDRRSATQILFDEWGTTGKNRPNLGHLLHLMIHTNVFRAADYVAQELLGEDLPKRPLTGPGAPIVIPPSEDTNEINEMLDEFDYPESLPVQNLLRDNNVDDREKIACCDFKKSTAGKLDNQETLPEAVNQIIVNLPTEMIPKWESLITNENDQRNASADSNSNISDTIQTFLNDSLSNNNTIGKKNNDPIPSSLIKFSEENIPILSILGNNIEIFDNVAHISFPTMLDDIPDFEALQISKSIQTYSTSSSSIISENSRSEITSDMQNEPRILQFFEFEDLKNATDNFNEKYKIGTGGYSEVYLAGNLAAKKLFSDKPKYREKFELEIQILSKIKHENIVPLLGFSSDGPELCLIYEYFPEGSLEMKLEGSRESKIVFDWSQRFRILYGSIDAIHHIHDQNIIHRDIKAANVLISSGNIAKLCDFGLLRMLSSENTSEIAGTNPYMSDEIFRGALTKKTDIFALGIMILETVTGLNVYSVELKSYTIEFLQKNNNDTKNLIDNSAGTWSNNSIKTGGSNIGHVLILLALKCVDDESILDIKNVKDEINKLWREIFY